MNEECQTSKARVEEILNKTCQNKFNTLENCRDDHDDCSCSSSGSEERKVDLVLLIDSSTTMPSKAALVNQAAGGGLDKAKIECNADVRTVWLFVDSAKPGSSTSHGLGGSAGNFNQSHQKYLESIGATGPFFHDNLDTGYAREQGADAIADISKFFDWREEACRSIFYISDTKLEGFLTHAPDSDTAVAQAVTVANQNDVTVFAHRCDPATYTGTMTIGEIDEDYRNLCNGTGGYAETGGAPSVALYEQLLTKAICNCNGCNEVEFPEIKPCISITWGDSECDCMETDDFEILCISVCNCYSNVTFSNLTIGFLEITDSNGNPVPNLPDGTPSVQAIPMGPICFGDVPPCKDAEPSCISREFVINTRGAKDGEYLIKLGPVCFDITHGYVSEACFKLKLCKS